MQSTYFCGTAVCNFVGVLDDKLGYLMVMPLEVSEHEYS